MSSWFPVLHVCFCLPVAWAKDYRLRIWVVIGLLMCLEKELWIGRIHRCIDCNSWSFPTCYWSLWYHFSCHCNLRTHLEINSKECQLFLVHFIDFYCIEGDEDRSGISRKFCNKSFSLLLVREWPVNNLREKKSFYLLK